MIRIKEFSYGLGLLALAVCGLASGGAALAVDFSWNVASGDFATGTNWLPVGVPGSGDNAMINNAGTSMYTSGSRSLEELRVGSQPGTSGTYTQTGGDLTAVRFLFGEAGTAAATVSGGTLEAFSGEADIFVGGESGPGTGTLTISGASTVVNAGDDFIMGRTGTGTLNVNSGLVKGGYTVVGKFGTGLWNHSGGVFDQSFGDIEIGDGGTPDQEGTPGPRTGTINLTGGVIQGAGHLAISNRRGTGTVNVSGGALALTGEVGDGAIIIGRGMDWDGNPGTGGPTELRVTGDDSIIIANGNLEMNVNGVASSSTLTAEITGPTHTTIKVAGNALIANGTLKVDLTGYTPVSGNSWTILTAGADLTLDETVVDALVIAGGYPALTHNPPNDLGTLQGTFANTDFSLAPLPAGLSWDVSYANNSVVLSVTGSAAFEADFNSDGRVDGADLNEWRGDFGVNDDSDADGDMDSDGNDFLIWQRQVGSGIPASANVAAIPEPAAIGMALTGIALLISGARRRNG